MTRDFVMDEQFGTVEVIIDSIIINQNQLQKQWRHVLTLMAIIITP